MVKIAGVLNVTPDSFSDGGLYCGRSAAISRAREMLRQGASIIDIGGDSTRPGSVCVGPDEELSRVLPIVAELSGEAFVSIDTHHAVTAKKALAVGAKLVNDVSGGGDPGMFAVVAEASAKIVIMYSRCPRPHEFGPEPAGDLIENCKRFFLQRIEAARICGLSESSIILDPGMGAFVSSNPDCSYEILRRLAELAELGLPLMIGISRKGFLTQPGELNITDRDALSARLAAQAAELLRGSVDLYIRAHNAVLHSRIAA